MNPVKNQALDYKEFSLPFKTRLRVADKLLTKGLKLGKLQRF